MGESVGRSRVSGLRSQVELTGNSFISWHYLYSYLQNLYHTGHEGSTKGSPPCSLFVLCDRDEEQMGFLRLETGTWRET